MNAKQRKTFTTNARLNYLIDNGISADDIYDKIMASPKISLGDNANASSMRSPVGSNIVRPPFNQCYFEISHNQEDKYCGYLVSVEDSNDDKDKFFLDIIFIYQNKENINILCVSAKVCSMVDKDKRYSFTFKSVQDDNSELYLNDSQKQGITNMASKCFYTLAAISCSNVELVDNVKYKKKSNGRKGKGLPLYSYKTLHINPNKTNARNISDNIGTHASPRLHLRRGHIRKLPSGLTTWVQSCMVGTQDNGIIEKDYVVTT